MTAIARDRHTQKATTLPRAGESLRILFIGNGNLKFAGLRHFGYDTRIFNGLVRNGHCVYFFSDRDEVRHASPFGILKPLGRRRANDKLLEVVENIKPDAIVLAHVDTIYGSTFHEIRRRLPDIRIAHINVDALFGANNKAKLLGRRHIVDATFITTGGEVLSEIAGPQSPCYFIPNFSDSSIDRGMAFAHPDLKYDVACFMHADSGKPGDEAERLELANGLISAIPDLRTCYGGFNGVPSMRGHAYLDSLAEAAMGLNLSKHVADNCPSSPETRYLYSSDRIAHLTGNGCLVLTREGFGLEHLYGSDEVVFFQDLLDLVDKVRYYKQNVAARQSIARKGWIKAHTQFNSTIIMKYVLERLFEKQLSQSYAWPLQAYWPTAPADVLLTEASVEPHATRSLGEVGSSAAASGKAGTSA